MRIELLLSHYKSKIKYLLLVFDFMLGLGADWIDSNFRCGFWTEDMTPAFGIYVHLNIFFNCPKKFNELSASQKLLMGSI